MFRPTRLGALAVLVLALAACTTAAPAAPTPRPAAVAATLAPGVKAPVGEVVSYTISPRVSTSRRVPEGTKLTEVSTDSVRGESTAAAKSALYVEWILPAKTLPKDKKVLDVHTLVCGSVSGDLYEVYGPSGSAEVEYEETPPGPDGCWHFTQDPGSDYRVEMLVESDSIMTIYSIEFRVTFAK